MAASTPSRRARPRITGRLGERGRRARLFDPYQCGGSIPCPVVATDSDPLLPCPQSVDPDDPNWCDPRPPTTGGPSQPARPLRDRSATPASQPTWPSLWVGDVISGEKDCGSTSGSSSGCKPSSGGGSSFSNLGHSLIVTELDSGENWGGDFTNDLTLSMEAIGFEDNDEDEVTERKAYTWFDSPNLEHALVLYHRMATWTERHAAVAYARAQDPDPYSATTMKHEDDEWYCSKLVWKAYKEATGNSLDPNWGPFVFPSDLERSGHLVTVYHYEHE